MKRRAKSERVLRQSRQLTKNHFPFDCPVHLIHALVALPRSFLFPSLHATHAIGEAVPLMAHV